MVLLSSKEDSCREESAFVNSLQRGLKKFRELKILIPLDYGDISLSVLKSQELGLEGAAIMTRNGGWTWPILK